MTKKEKNPNIKAIKITNEIYEEVKNKIIEDFNTLDPPIKYDILLLNKNENDKYIKVSIHDREFVLSSFFTSYLVDLQFTYLWPKQIYDVIFLYEP